MKTINIRDYKELHELWLDKHITGDQFLRNLGYTSAVFDNSFGKWYLSDEDFTWFSLRWTKS